MSELLEYSSHPLVLACLLIIFAWVWEDASLISGALLAADGKLPVALAAPAVFIGITSSDFALYLLGRLAHRWRRLRGWVLTNRKSRRLGRRFRQRTFLNIVFIRFIPGLRTVGFTLCGLWRLSYGRFLSAMMFSGLIWVAIIFSLVYALGSSAWFADSHWKWSLMAVALALLLWNNVFAQRRQIRAVKP